MKRTLYFIALAVLMAFASCQKEEAEQPRASLSLLMETFSSDAKLHIENVSLPVWDGGDALWINGSSCSVTLDGGRAKVRPAVSPSYKIVYPYSIVGTESGNKVGVTLPYEQTYAVNGSGQQLITAPLCGAVTSGNSGTLYNLGALVRVDLYNALDEEVTLQRIRLQSQKCKLSGAFEVDDLSSSTPVMAPVSAKAYSDKDSWVSLSFGSSGLAQAHDLTTPKSFYLAIPPCTTSGKFAIEVYYTRGERQYRQTIVSEDAITIARNVMPYVTMALTTAHENLIPEDPYNVNATLKTIANNWQMWGSDPDSKIEIVMFQFNSGSDFDVTKNYVYIGGTRCYAEWDSEQKGMIIHVPAASLTNVDFSGMFAYMTKLVHVMFQGNLPGTEGTITATGSTAGMFAGCSKLGSYFQVSGPLDFSTVNLDAVTNTSYMFRGCTSLTSITWPTFGSSAATVTDMRLMFANCTSLNQANVPFHTAATTNMKMMFGGCTWMTSIQLAPSFVVADMPNRQDMLYQTAKDNPFVCRILCTDEQWAALQTGTGIDPTKCTRDGSK